MSVLRWSLRLCLVVVSAAITRAEDWAPNLTASATWHSNATLADRSSDQLESLQLGADVLAGKRYAITRSDGLRLNAHFAGEWWPRYSELLRGAAGGRVEWRHEFGRGPLAPSVAVEGAGDYVSARETGRRGFATSVSVSARKRLNNATRVTLRHEVSWMAARYATFDSGASETSLDLDYDLTPKTRLTLTGRLRDGDIVSYATGFRPELEARAPNRIDLTTYERAMTAYRIDAQTWSGRASLVRAVDDSSAILLSYEYRNTERGPLRFPDHLLSIALVHQF